MAVLLPNGKQYYTTNGGLPLVGGKLYTYEAGTLIPKLTYSDAAATVPNPNPVFLDSRGEAIVFWSGTYKVELRDSVDNVIWTIDNIVSSNETTTALIQEFRDQLADTANSEFGAGMVGFNPQLNYVANTVGWGLKLDAINVKWFGAIGDNVADDSVALSALVTFVNAIPLSPKPVPVYLPPGIYKYSSLLTFARPVYLFGEGGATLNYTGAAAALKLGPDGITSFDVFTQGEYTVDGIRFIGGATAVHGIYVNEYIIEPRLRNLTFEDFGNSACYDIYTQFENWDVIIENCRKLTFSGATAVGNFIAITGRKRDLSAYDGGNSRVTIRDCWMTSYSGQTLGYFAYVNAVKCRIIGGGFQHSAGVLCLAVLHQRF